MSITRPLLGGLYSIVISPTVRVNTHRTAHISMYDFQQVTCPFHCSGEWCFSHLSHEAWFARVKSSDSKSPLAWSFFALHQYDLSGNATRNWYYHYQLSTFGINVMNM